MIEAHRLLKSAPQSAMVFAPARQTTADPRTLILTITLEEAVKGGCRRLTLPGGRKTDLRLPKGLRPGEVLRLRRKDAGDLLVQILFRPAPGVSVRGDDLWLEVTAPTREVRAGARLELDTPHGRRVLIAPEGAAEGKPIRLKGEGLPARGRHLAGDLILKLRLEPPASDALSEESLSKGLLRRFSARWAA